MGHPYFSHFCGPLDRGWCTRAGFALPGWVLQAGVAGWSVLSELRNAGTWRARSLPSSVHCGPAHSEMSVVSEAASLGGGGQQCLYLSCLSLAFGFSASERASRLYSVNDSLPTVICSAACSQYRAVSSKLWGTCHACRRFLILKVKEGKWAEQGVRATIILDCRMVKNPSSTGD